MDSADRRNLGALPNPDIVIRTDARAQNDKILKGRAAGNSCLRDYNAMPANTDIVAYLYEVVDLGAFTNYRVADCAPVDRGTGPDLDVVLDYNAPDLRDLEVTTSVHYESESVLANLAAGVNNNAITEQGVADDRSCADRRAASDPDIGADDGICSYDSVTADFHARADHRPRLDCNTLLQPRALVDVRIRKIARLRQRRRSQRLREHLSCGSNESAIRLTHRQRGDASRKFLCERRSREAGACMRSGRRRNEIPAVEEGQIRRRSAIERRNIDDPQGFWSRRCHRGAGQRSDLPKRETPGLS